MTTRRIRGARKGAGWISGVRLEPEPAPAVRWRPIARTRASAGSSELDLARGQLRRKRDDLVLALEGRMEEHHRFLLATQLRRLEAAEQDIAALDDRIEAKLAPYCVQHALLMQIPGVDWVVAAALIAEIGVDMSVFLQSPIGGPALRARLCIDPDQCPRAAGAEGSPSDASYLGRTGSCRRVAPRGSVPDDVFASRVPPGQASAPKIQGLRASNRDKTPPRSSHIRLPDRTQTDRSRPSCDLHRRNPR